ncbi:peptidoglycan recognition protein family protein [Pseudomonas sp. SDO528_S397]
MVDDWDYSMIALHHAGRSVGCGAGAGQMRAIQSEHQAKFDDIGYRYGIDCTGKVFEGRDIRFKGSSVHNYNTGVIGIVLLENLTTAEEGGDMVAFARQALESISGNMDQKISAIQIDTLHHEITPYHLPSFTSRRPLHRVLRENGRHLSGKSIFH